MHGDDYCKEYDVIQAVLFTIGLIGLLGSVALSAWWLIIPVLFWGNCQALYWWCAGGAS